MEGAVRVAATAIVEIATAIATVPVPAERKSRKGPSVGDVAALMNTLNLSPTENASVGDAAAKLSGAAGVVDVNKGDSPCIPTTKHTSVFASRLLH